MAKIRIIEPKAVSYSITIAVPMSKPIVVFANKDIFHWEESFINLRDKAVVTAEKKDYDRCRATLKWASTCGASLVKVANCADAFGKTIEFTFAFADLAAMCDFDKNLKTSVAGSMMF